MNRRWLCASTAVVCLLTQAAFASNIFVSGQDPASSQLSAITTDPFTFGSALSTIPGTVAVFGSTTGQKFYAIGASSTDSVAVLSGGFPYVSLGTHIQVNGPATAGALSPDGRRLVVVGRLGTAVIDTTSDQVSVGMGGIDTGFSPTSVAISVDSRYAYVLSPSSGRVTQVDLTTSRAVTTASVPSTSTGIAVAPTGVVYVSAPGGVYELDPITLATRAFISVSGTPDKLQFTPSTGRDAIARDLNSSTGRSLIEIDTQSRAQITTPGGSTFSKFVVVSDNLGYGLVSGTLVEVQIDNAGNIVQTTPTATGTIPSGIADIAASGETPSSRHLLISAGTNVYDFNLRTRDVTSSVFTGYTGYISSIVPAGLGGVVTTTLYNQSQTVAAGTTSLPLVLGTFDLNGQPLPNVNVTFATTTSGVTISNASTATNISGLAVTTVAVPSGASGTIPITATFGNRVVNYTITVGNPNLPGGGTGGGTPATGVAKFIPVSGQGEVLLAGFSTAFQEPLRAQYLDANGNPVPNVQVTWAVVSDAGLPVIADNNGLTDSNGTSTANFTTQFLFSAGVPYRQFTITATSPDGQVLTYYVTAVRTTNGGTGGLVVTPSQFNGATITAQSGTVNPAALTFQVRTALDGALLPNVGLRLIIDPATGRSITCQGGPTVYSDASGNITCDLVVTGGLGTATFTANVGGGNTLYTYNVNVQAGAPATMNLVSGNNQNVSPNQLMQPFVVQVTDAANNPLSGVSVRWTNPGGLAGAVSEQTSTDANGRAAAQYNAPSSAGTYYFQVTSGSIVQSFMITVGGGGGGGGATGLQVASGNQQTANAGQAFGQQLQVKLVNASGSGVANTGVSFAVTSGSASVSPSSATTDANGVATASVTAGQTSGPVVVTATSGNLTAQFSLTVSAAPNTIPLSNILNAASFTTGVSPGSIAYIRAPGIAPNLRGSTTPNPVIGPLPTTLAGVQVLVNGVAAPIYAVSNINGEESVIVQIPFETPVGLTQIVVNYANGATTTASNVPILAVKPGLFSYTSTRDNAAYATATRPDGSYVGPDNPVRRGETIRVYATGLGQTSVPTATNRVGVPGQTVLAPLVVGVNNAGVRLISAELLAGEIGVYVLTLEVPVDTQTGPRQPIGLGVDRPDGSGTEYANTVFVPIQ